MNIRDLATQIAADGLKWEDDGDLILAICVEVEAQVGDLRANAPEVLHAYIHSTLVALDKAYGWDMPAIGQQTEERFYGAFVGLYMTPIGRIWALEKHAKVTARL